MADHGESGLAGDLTPDGHRLAVRVYYADTDFSGVVYHARYLEFLERGRSDYLRLLGIRHAELAEGRRGQRLIWVLRRMEIDFVRPASIDDVLTIATRIDAASGARARMRQTILRGEAVLIEAAVEAAIVGENGRPRRFPREWLASFAASAAEDG